MALCSNASLSQLAVGQVNMSADVVPSTQFWGRVVPAPGLREHGSAMRPLCVRTATHAVSELDSVAEKQQERTNFFTAAFQRRESNMTPAAPQPSPSPSPSAAAPSAAPPADSAAPQSPSSMATAAVYTGVGAMGLLFGGAVLSSVEALPIIPQALQAAGVVYCALVARQSVVGRDLNLRPLSPVKAVTELMDASVLASRPAKTDLSFVKDLDQAAAKALEELAEQRDSAVSQMQEMQRATGEFARVVAEKEALEAVAMQLAEERDTAMSEVSALRRAVDLMTERMRSIEAMLEMEVTQLKNQNLALETVALQLAAERDAALLQVGEVRAAVPGDLSSKVNLGQVVRQLAAERDLALREISSLRAVVAELQVRAEGGADGREGAGAGVAVSGLTEEQETFIKSRVAAIRGQFIALERPYDEQREAVDDLVAHLVEEYGAPAAWTREYMQSFLSSSRKEDARSTATMH